VVSFEGFERAAHLGVHRLHGNAHDGRNLGVAQSLLAMERVDEPAPFRELRNRGAHRGHRLFPLELRIGKPDGTLEEDHGLRHMRPYYALVPEIAESSVPKRGVEVLLYRMLNPPRTAVSPDVQKDLLHEIFRNVAPRDDTRPERAHARVVRAKECLERASVAGDDRRGEHLVGNGRRCWGRVAAHAQSGEIVGSSRKERWWTKENQKMRRMPAA